MCFAHASGYQIIMMLHAPESLLLPLLCHILHACSCVYPMFFSPPAACVEKGVYMDWLLLGSTILMGQAQWLGVCYLALEFWILLPSSHARMCEEHVMLPSSWAFPRRSSELRGHLM